MSILDALKGYTEQRTSGMTQEQKQAEYDRALDALKRLRPGYVEQNMNNPDLLYKTGSDLADFADRFPKDDPRGYENMVQKHAEEQAYWENFNNDWAKKWDKESMEALQNVYNPDVKARREATDFLNQKMGTENWNYMAPHVMETGNIMGSELPGFLAQHWERYKAVTGGNPEQVAANQAAVNAMGRDKFNDLYSKTYSADLTTRRKAIAELEAAFGPYWHLVTANPSQSNYLELIKASYDPNKVNQPAGWEDWRTRGGGDGGGGTGGGWTPKPPATPKNPKKLPAELQNEYGKLHQPATDWINLLMWLGGFLE
jgi:hypothetical protein